MVDSPPPGVAMNALRYYWELLYDGAVTCYITIRAVVVYLFTRHDDEDWPGDGGYA